MIAEAEILKAKKPKLYSLEEYFKLEEKALHKSEFRNGKIINMPGGTLAHNIIKVNITSRLFVALIENEDYYVFDSDQKIFIPVHMHNVYADASVVSGEPKMYQNSNQAIINPTLIVEVLSNSTGNYDRGEKFRKYQTLSSFKEYVLVDQDAPIVDVLCKIEDRNWQLKTYIGLDDVVELKSIGVNLNMSDIFKKVKNLKNPQTTLDFEGE